MKNPNRVIYTLLLYSCASCLLNSCTKKNTNPTTITDSTQKPIKSLIVTYPLVEVSIIPFRQLNYTFAQDTVNNSYGIQIVDSSTNTGTNSYDIYRTLKTYYLTASVPRRVTKISFRQSHSGTYTAVTPYIDYDILFDYDDYTYDPDHITVINYSDLAGTQITNQYTAVVGKYASNYYEAGSTLDIVNCLFYQATRMPLKTFTWVGENGNFGYEAYTDSSFEVTESDMNYNSIFFSNSSFGNPTTGFKYKYSFNSNHQCQDFSIDLLSSDYLTLYGQAKFDYTFDGSANDMTSVFNLLCVPNSLFWEKAAQQSTGIVQYNAEGIFEYTDPYMPDVYSYYGNICSSYTDSLFSVDNNGNKTLQGADTFFNKVVKDNNGNISSITMTDAGGNIIRNITVGY